ncbi:lipocalin family protein [Roseivirga sp. 4D4]|uniref:lipocalin family protein n=1 Tax=Roseivirga sp. 4D4 TaxID=1889784 RepID=UPI001481672D|nr:lipocalin family protein [Roseivirga sp. 4D4]
MKIQKRIIGLLLLVLFISACDNEPSGTPEDDASELVGIWTVTFASAANCDDPDENLSFAPVCTSTDCLKVEFKADGTFVSTDLEDGVTTINNGTYTVSGNQMTITEDMDVQVATFEIESGTLTLQGNEAETGCDVSTTLTKDS